MRYIFSTFLLLAFFQLRAQTGNYFLSHYSPGEDRVDNVCFDIVQDDRGLFFYATRNGLLQFDGKNWDLIPGGAIYSLQLSPQGEVYWAGATGYGKVEQEVNGNHRLKILSSEGTRDVFQCEAAQNKFYFLSDRLLYIEQNQASAQKVNATDETGTFVGMFELFGSIYINTEKDGVYKVDDNGVLIKSSLSLPDSEGIIFSVGLKNHYLIGLTNNKVLLFGEDLRPTELSLHDQPYLDASVVVSGAWVNQDLFVLGTLRGGLVFIQVATGKTQEIINYSTGLPDNEVYALTSDHNQSIWAAHEYGFTRVSPYLPFRSFNHYPGIEGNLLCAHSFNDEVYVGTSLGLFKLQKEEFYEELTYYIDVEIKDPKARQPKAKDAVIEPRVPDEVPPTETESKKRGFLRFLKKNRNAEKDKPAATPPEKSETKPDAKPDVAEISTQPKYHRIKKTERILRESQYVYKRVAGVEAKVTQLLEHDGHLLAAGLGGLFEINGLQSTPIFQQPVRITYASDVLNGVVIGTYSDKVHAFRNGSDKKWSEINFLSNLDDQIISIVDGPQQELWLCALNKAYKVSFDEVANVKHVESIEIPNQSYDDVACVNWNDNLVMVNTNGFFQYRTTTKTFVKIDSLAPPEQYFHGENSILFNDSHRWNLLGQKGHQSNLQLLNLLHNLRFVSGNYSADNLWVITEKNELFRFFGEMFTPYEAGYSLLVKSIRKGDKEIQLNKLEFEQDKSPVTIRITQPDYLAPQAIEYRYQLKGLDNKWSDWSSHYNSIDFPYLPSGDYTLAIQSRDVLGVVRELDTISFEVLPPYWKRPWFYALEFFVFAGFVLLSFRLSTRYQIISRLLSLLTIIMLIQFIQTVVSEVFETRASPVTDFFMQVLVAFLILPVEGYLRELMLRSLNAKGKLYQFLARKANQTPGENDS